MIEGAVDGVVQVLEPLLDAVDERYTLRQLHLLALGAQHRHCLQRQRVFQQHLARQVLIGV